MEDLETKVRRYIELTGKALENVDVVSSPDTVMGRFGREMVDMARRYWEDSKYFLEKGDFTTALAAVSYAHAWLDIGVRLGILRGRIPKYFMQ